MECLLLGVAFMMFVLMMLVLSGPVLRESPRDSLSDTPRACALWGFWCLNMAKWVRYPLPLF